MKLDTIKHTLLKAAMASFPERKLFCPMPFKMIEIADGHEHRTLECRF